MRSWIVIASIIGAGLAAGGVLAGRGGAAIERGPMPGTIESVAVYAPAKPGGAALLVVRPAPGAAMPAAFDYPYDNKPVTVNDRGAAGDRRAGDGLYSAAIGFDRAAFARRIAGNARRLAALALAAPPVLSLRFDAAARGAAKIRVSREAEAAADRRYRVLAGREAAAAVAAVARPASARDPALFEIVRGHGISHAQVLGRPVPMELLAQSADIVLPADINPARSLVITDPAVLEDPARTYDRCNNHGNPNGVWSFKHLITAIANTPATGVPPEELASEVLAAFRSAQTSPDGFTVAARPAYPTRYLDPWLANGPDGNSIDLDQAPFRLLAIVVRPDLASGGYGGGAGELRFVFGILPDAPCGPIEFSTMILEYKVPGQSCTARKHWNEQWYALSDPASGIGAGSDYDQQLEALTEQIVHANALPGQHPNRSALGQLRINDLTGGDWDLFEFRLNSAGTPHAGHFALSTVKQTPDISFHDQPAQQAALASWVNANQAAILANTHVVPETLGNGAPFLGGEAPIFNNDAAFTWQSALGQSPTNFAFSIATCNGCHSGDTGGFFTHILTRLPGFASDLSTFLTNPGGGAQDEFERRAQVMADTIDQACVALPVVSALPSAFVD